MKKSLLEIRQDILALDRKAMELSADVTALYNAIDEIESSHTVKTDFETIHLLSQNYKFSNHPISHLSDDHAKALYLKYLLSLIQLDSGSDKTVARLIFAQWILTQAGLDASLEELFTSTLRFKPSDFGELSKSISEPYRECLVMDALLTANLCGIANESLFSYIAGLCSLWNISAKELSALSLAAKCVLINNFEKDVDKIGLKNVLNKAICFRHYVREDVLEQAYMQYRLLALKQYSNSVRWNFANNSEVHQGDIIAQVPNDYYYKWHSADPTLTVSGPVQALQDGIMIRFVKDGISYGVITCAGDNPKSVRDWVLPKKSINK